MISVKVWMALSAFMCLAVAQPLPAGLVVREKAGMGTLPTPARVKIVARPHTITSVVDSEEADIVPREKASLGTLPTPEGVKIVARPYTIPYGETEEADVDA
ncbi:hypothetical protein F4818DRAFT_416629 [Hypoxylon cercidicola]|nr:hypothetical protein F4818DRAFT_416629 [Hypoxylon cercidicola]